MNAVAREVAQQLLAREREGTLGGRSTTGSAASKQPAEPVVETPPLRLNEIQARRHVEVLSTVLQALTLRGRALGREQEEALAEDPAVAAMGEEERELLGVLVRVHTLVLEHPLACRGLFSALAAEGRQYGRTPQGAVMRERLEHSRLVRRGALLWHCLTMGITDEREPTTLPSTCLDTLTEVALRTDLEPLLGTLREVTAQ